jgi:hypothetical protein
MLPVRDRLGMETISVIYLCRSKYYDLKGASRTVESGDSSYHCCLSTPFASLTFNSRAMYGVSNGHRGSIIISDPSTF